MHTLTRLSLSHTHAQTHTRAHVTVTASSSDPTAAGFRAVMGGLGILSSFYLTDCLQICTGGRLYFCDPSSDFFWEEEVGRGGEGGENRNRDAGICRAFSLTSQGSQKPGSGGSGGGGGALLETRFPDQLSPFLSLLAQPIPSSSAGSSVVFQGEYFCLCF